MATRMTPALPRRTPARAWQVPALTLTLALALALALAAAPTLAGSALT